MGYGSENTAHFLRELSQREDLTDWESGFISSVSKGFSRYGSLTEGQQGVFQKIVDKYSDESLARRASWEDNYDGKARTDFLTMVGYYKANPPYFSDVIFKAEKETFIPSEKLWRSMCENKYAKRVLATTSAGPLYPDGTLVIIRNTGQVPGYLGFLRGKPAFVISHPAGVYSAAKGSKRVVILPIGASEIIETEERWLKPERNLPAKRGDYSDIEEGDG